LLGMPTGPRTGRCSPVGIVSLFASVSRMAPCKPLIPHRGCGVEKLKRRGRLVIQPFAELVSFRFGTLFFDTRFTSDRTIGTAGQSNGVRQRIQNLFCLAGA